MSTEFFNFALHLLLQEVRAHAFEKSVFHRNMANASAPDRLDINVEMLIFSIRTQKRKTLHRK